MTKRQQINQDILTYHRLKRHNKLISEQLERLNKKIKTAITDYCMLNEGESPTIGWHALKGYKVEVQVKRGKPKVDEGTLEQLLTEKGLWEECTRRQIDESLVEQAFIEGKLTDSDLRSINQGSKITTALIVSKVEEADVQAQDESNSS